MADVRIDPANLNTANAANNIEADKKIEEQKKEEILITSTAIENSKADTDVLASSESKVIAKTANIKDKDEEDETPVVTDKMIDKLTNEAEVSSAASTSVQNTMKQQNSPSIAATNASITAYGYASMAPIPLKSNSDTDTEKVQPVSEPVSEKTKEIKEANGKKEIKETEQPDKQVSEKKTEVEDIVNEVVDIVKDVKDITSKQETTKIESEVNTPATVLNNNGNKEVKEKEKKAEEKKVEERKVEEKKIEEKKAEEKKEEEKVDKKEKLKQEIEDEAKKINELFKNNKQTVNSAKVNKNGNKKNVTQLKKDEKGKWFAQRPQTQEFKARDSYMMNAKIEYMNEHPEPTFSSHLASLAEKENNETVVFDFEHNQNAKDKTNKGENNETYFSEHRKWEAEYKKHMNELEKEYQESHKDYREQYNSYKKAKLKAEELNKKSG